MSNLDSKREVSGIVLFFCAVALILMYYLPETVTGVFGRFMRSLGFGLIGSAAFLIPVFLLYAAIDFFMEKREGVSPIRVRSVILFMIGVSALLCLFSVDFDYFRSLCVTEDASKLKATTAISLLWKSGPDTSLITPAANSSNSLSGGLLGGGIAVALYSIAGRTISILSVIVFILAQVILVFHISLKKTAKKTAHAVAHTARQAYDSVRRNNSAQQLARRRQYQQMPANYVQSNQVYRGPERSNINPRSPFVNAPTNIYNIPMPEIEYDPFNSKLPVDRKSGFVDMTSPEFGADTNPDTNSIAYGNRRVSTQGVADAPSADFDYTPLAKNPPLQPQRKREELSFLKKQKKQDFYDLSDGIYAGDNSNYSNNDMSHTENDAPYELVDDDPYNYGNSELREDIERRMEYAGRSVVAKPAEEDDLPVEVDEVENDIPINAEGEDHGGFSRTEGRIITTSDAPDKGVNIQSTSQSTRTPKVISRRKGPYKPAPLSLLAEDNEKFNTNNSVELTNKGHELEEALQSFGINAKVVNITHGPAITRFELTLDRGIKVSKVLSLQDDIALAMAAVSVRIEAPIPGKSAIGIEIPNAKTSAVQLKSLLTTKEFKSGPPLEVPLGRDIPGRPIMCNIAKMPHMLIAGSTGSGKSVCINTILTSILYKSSPDDVKMILIDPKVVELSIYNGIPHLLMPVVTDAKKASNALKWAVMEMERRYKLFAECTVRDIAGYNEYLKYNNEKPLPLILVVIDELADLMMVAAKEVEDQISRLAAVARAAGLHLIIATQRPSVDVLTGVIKANIASRIAFAVSSGVDSRTILDSVGAEKLLGKGDMLYAPMSAPKPIRGQGAFLTDKEVQSVVEYLRETYGPLYDEDIEKIVNSGVAGGNGGASDVSGGGSDEDELLNQAVNIVIEAGNASVSILQRRLGIGYPRAARLIDILEQKHIIGPFEGSKPRKVLVTKTDWLEMQSRGEGS